MRVVAQEKLLSGKNFNPVTSRELPLSHCLLFVVAMILLGFLINSFQGVNSIAIKEVLKRA